MGKAKLLLEIILPIIGLIALIGFALQYTDLQNEKLERLEQESQQNMMELDRLVNRAIVYCEGQSSTECDQIMQGWYNECKKEIMKEVPSCGDGRITEYLSKNNVSTESYLSSSTDRINKAALRLLDVCTEINTERSKIIAEYGPYIPEELEGIWKQLEEEMKSCRDSVGQIKQDCENKKSTKDYYGACDDPRLGQY